MQSVNLFPMSCCVALHTDKNKNKNKLFPPPPPVSTFSPDCNRKHKNFLGLRTQASRELAQGVSGRQYFVRKTVINYSIKSVCSTSQQTPP